MRFLQVAKEWVRMKSLCNGNGCKVVVFCLALTWISCYYYFTKEQREQKVLVNKKMRFENKTNNNRSNAKLILFWTKFWTWNYPLGLGDAPFRGCQHKNCISTYNRSMVNVEDFDAVVFHGSIYDKAVHGEPEVRKPHQRYIYFNTEAPPNKFDYNPDFTLFDSFYNWTITYRFDSDVLIRYGKVVARNSSTGLPTSNDVKKKTKLVAWFVSHCKTSSKREVLVEEMQKYVPVDVYGKCGNFSCARSGYFSTDHCYNMLQNTYKFYLSFENSLCMDYLTEKLYYVLKRNIIPVVYAGHTDVINAPPGSYINVKDFESVKILTDYLKFLDSNTTEYLKYFQWRRKYAITNNSPICDLCRKLNEPLNHKSYDDLYSWAWGTPNDPTCLFNDTLPSLVKNLQNVSTED